MSRSGSTRNSPSRAASQSATSAYVAPSGGDESLDASKIALNRLSTPSNARAASSRVLDVSSPAASASWSHSRHHAYSAYASSLALALLMNIDAR